MVTTETSSETKLKSKPLLNFSQYKSKALLDSDNFFDRVCKALDVENVYGAKAKVAQITGLTKTAIGQWEKGEMPGKESLQNLAKISELSGASLHWLLTGEGQEFINQKSEVSIDDIFERKMRIIAREEIKADAQKLVDSGDITSHAYFTLFGKTVKERLSEIADRLELVYKDAGKEIPPFIINEIAKFRKGEFSDPRQSKEVFFLTQIPTKTNIVWLVTGEGDRHDFRKTDESFSIFDFFREIAAAKQHEAKLIEQEREAQKEQTLTQNILNNLLRHLVDTNVIKLEDLGQIGGNVEDYKPPIQDLENDKRVA